MRHRHNYRKGKAASPGAASAGQGELGVSYVRVSDPKQEEEGLSIPAQRRMRDDYAPKRGIEVIEIFEETHSAKSSGGRKRFEAMLAYLEAHPEVKHVLVDKVDRLHRNPIDQARLWTQVLRGCQIHIIRHGKIISRNSPAADKLMYFIEGALGTFHSDNLVEEVMKGLNEKAKRGGFPTRAPIGYLNDRNTRGVVVDAERAPFIRRAFELYATGQHSISSVRNALVSEGFRTRSGKRPGTSQIELVLKNPFYYGEFRWNGELYSGNHPPLISRELFDRVQALLTRGKPMRYRAGSHAFGNRFISCGHCDCAITAEKVKGGRYIYYRCTNGRGPCRQKRVTEVDLADQFHDALQVLRLPDEFARWAVAVIDQANFHAEAQRKVDLARLQESLQTLRRRMDAAYVDKVDGNITEAWWREKSAEWQAEVTLLEGRIEALGRVEEKVADRARATFELVEMAPALFLRQSSTEKRDLLNHVLLNCKMLDGRIVPEFRKPFSLLAQAATGVSGQQADPGPEDPGSANRWH